MDKRGLNVGLTINTLLFDYNISDTGRMLNPLETAINGKEIININLAKTTKYSVLVDTSIKSGTHLPRVSEIL